MTERGNKILHFIDFYAGIPISFLTSVFRRIDKHFISKHSLSSPKIGIICLGAIGDLLLLTGLINGIRKKFPDAQIEIISSNANSQALPLLPEINNSFSFSVKNIKEITKFLRNRRYDFLFDSTQWAKIGSILSNLSGARQTIGFITKHQFRSSGYDIKVPHLSSIHESENFLNLGKNIWKDLDGKPAIFLPNEDTLLKNKIVFCHMWSLSSRCKKLKEWPEDYWAQIVKKLLDEGYCVGLTGSKADIENVNDFVSRFFPHNNQIHNYAGKISLKTLAELFRQSAAVISIDTGIMHLAGLLNIPLIGLIGPANPIRWGPLGNKTIQLVPEKGMKGYLDLGIEYPKNVEPCMQNLPVSSVLQALIDLKIITNKS